MGVIYEEPGLLENENSCVGTWFEFMKIKCTYNHDGEMIVSIFYANRLQASSVGWVCLHEFKCANNLFCWSQYGHSTVTVRSQYGLQYGHSTVI